jgi:aspartyl-tRNA(Asn)/glutamyl-tRNA(Gln) amidotransferase subunit C
MKDHHIDIRKIARLARLRLTDEEAETFTRQLDEVLGYVDKLSNLDLDNVEASAHPRESEDVLREDEIRPCLDQEQALLNAPKRSADQFIVPKVVE